MEQVKRRRLIHRQQQQLEHFPVDLIQLIQLKLPSKDAARTCIVSKSWLHAWSTSPAIRFCPSLDSLKRQHQRKYMRWIHLTLLSYHRHNLPFTSLDLQLGIYTTHRAARKLIMQATSKNSLKELRLTILALSFTLPDEIFSSKHLNTLCLELLSPHDQMNRSLHISNNHAIRCTNLRVLQLSHVNISEHVFNELISKNKLLEKIILQVTPALNEIRVSNLRYLREFLVCLSTVGWIDILEIYDVPSLRSLVYNASMIMSGMPPSIFRMGTLQSLRELQLDNLYMDDAFSNMIKSNFPFLEKLILQIKWCSVEILHITCLTLLELTIFFTLDEEIKVEVYAPNLLTYTHTSSAVPSLLFTTTPPRQIDLILPLATFDDGSLFLKMRETLKLSSKFNIEISSFRFEVCDDVKTIVQQHPATNVEKLLLEEHSTNNSFWENSLLLDTVFSTCHPMYVKTNNQLRLEVGNYFLKLLLKGVMEICEIRDSLNGRWVALTSSSLSLLDATTPCDFYEFKLCWCSQ